MNRPAILNVHGTASREVDPDLARVSVAVEATHKEREPALAAAEVGAEAVRSALSGQSGVRSLLLSGARVERRFRWDQKKGTQVPTGWRAEVTGRVDSDTDAVAAIIEVVVGAGALVRGVGWMLLPDNPAHRQVRRDAVADAFRAAADFADAVERPLGALRTLADAGLLGGDGDPTGPRARAMMAGSAPVEGVALEIDPEPQQLVARVEASFELG